LQKNFGSSRWVNDAKALEAEVRQANGQPLSPESESDEDLKLLAINSLVASDPDRAVPLLDKILQSRNSPKLKERALFVLAQTKNPKAQEIVVRYAKGSGNPDLQLRAVEYLGVYGGRENAQTLADVYAGSNDPSLKRTVLHSFFRAKDKDRMIAILKTEQNASLKAEGIRLLGNTGAIADITQFYTPDASPEVKSAVLDALYSANAADRLIELARTEKDQRIRTEAIHRLGSMRRTKTSDALVQMYTADSDKESKRAIMNALYGQGSAKEIVDIAKKETDPEMRRQAVRMLSGMKSKEATDFLAELLNK
jgi:HEAT repeat protein